jgi:hypothetical protein
VAALPILSGLIHFLGLRIVFTVCSCSTLIQILELEGIFIFLKHFLIAAGSRPEVQAYTGLLMEMSTSQGLGWDGGLE